MLPAAIKTVEQFLSVSLFNYYAPHHSKCLDTSKTPHQTEVLCDCAVYLLCSTSGFSEVLENRALLGRTHCTVPTHLERCLQRVEAPKTQQLNMRRPEYGADVRRNA